MLSQQESSIRASSISKDPLWLNVSDHNPVVFLQHVLPSSNPYKRTLSDPTIGLAPQMRIFVSYILGPCSNPCPFCLHPLLCHSIQGSLTSTSSRSLPFFCPPLLTSLLSLFSCTIPQVGVLPWEQRTRRVSTFSVLGLLLVDLVNLLILFLSKIPSEISFRIPLLIFIPRTPNVSYNPFTSTYHQISPPPLIVGWKGIMLLIPFLMVGHPTLNLRVLLLLLLPKTRLWNCVPIFSLCLLMLQSWSLRRKWRQLSSPSLWLAPINSHINT